MGQRLIDAKVYRMELYDEMNYPGRSEEFMAAIDVAIADLSDAPTVDAVEVVRCKDCIRRYDTDECPMCYLSEGKYYEYTNENGFCDRGERKEGANND